MDGLLLIDKPRGVTSHDVVARVRRALGIQRVGHFGTLDPLATGLLVVAVGRAVKLFPLFSGHDKTYSGQMVLGVTTDTYDAEGAPMTKSGGPFPDRATLALAMSRFVGNLLQTPPAYSAKKLSGKPLYKWARSRQAAAVPPRPVRVDLFELRDYRPPIIEFEVRCGAGTYVRSLAHDLGESLGCGAYLAGLRRLSAGPISIEEAQPIERVEELLAAGRCKEVLRPLESLLLDLPKLTLTAAGAGRLQKGRALDPEDIQQAVPTATSPSPAACGSPAGCRLFDAAGDFLGLARPDPGGLHLVPFLVFRP